MSGCIAAANCSWHGVCMNNLCSCDLLYYGSRCENQWVDLESTEWYFYRWGTFLLGALNAVLGFWRLILLFHLPERLLALLAAWGCCGGSDRFTTPNDGSQAGGDRKLKPRMQSFAASSATGSAKSWLTATNTQRLCVLCI